MLSRSLKTHRTEYQSIGESCSVPPPSGDRSALVTTDRSVVGRPDRIPPARTGRALLADFPFWRMRNPPTPQRMEEKQKRHAAKHGHRDKVGQDGERGDDHEAESSRDAVPTPPPCEVGLSSWRPPGHMSGRSHQLVNSTHHAHPSKGTTKATGPPPYEQKCRIFTARGRPPVGHPRGHLLVRRSPLSRRASSPRLHRIVIYDRSGRSACFDDNRPSESVMKRLAL